MKIIIFSLFLVLSFISVANSDSGFILNKNKENNSIISKNVVNHSLYSSGYQSCINDCDSDFNNDYNFYCSGGYYDTQVCEILIDELYACYDYCDSSYP
jgi:hypothetical protein